MKRCIFSLLLLIITVGSASAEPAGKWLGPDNNPLPFSRDGEVLEFLRTARIVATKQLSSGINRPLKVKLEKDGIEANAIFRTVNTNRSYVRLDGKTYREFYDRHINECAAYELSRLLDLDNVPPCVPRVIGRKDGTLQLWVENAITFEKGVKEGLAGMSNRRWARQRQMMRVFDSLIFNIDRNQGNMLLDSAEKLWFIDHTRSFMLSREVAELEKIVWCERSMWERMQNLDEKLLQKHLSRYLDYRQIITVLKRRDKLVTYLQKLIDSRGEQAVLFNANSLFGSKEVVSGI
jgi:hypothetical protein